MSRILRTSSARNATEQDAKLGRLEVGVGVEKVAGYSFTFHLLSWQELEVVDRDQ
jgi:hypothetical protein